MSPPPSGGGPSEDDESPTEVREYASRAVDYVKRSLELTLEYDSETLPVLDHYLREVPGDNAAAAHLVAATAGAYFGEVVKRRIGGTWDLPSHDPGAWRLVLPCGVWFSPAAMALAAIRGPSQADDDMLDADEGTDPNVQISPEWDASLHAPPQLRGVVAEVLERMAGVSPETFYSLCGRLDTLEHVQSVLAGIASERN
ncbi:MAG TPA: hypothetical protein VMZ28_31490 [Kofleriaceae bacterium]|nr:hypothetical protein [Kofleriaceae bacterium]